MKVWDVSVPTFRPCKVYDGTGAEVPAVFRVEFDGDGDEGEAVVSRYEMTPEGAVVMRRVPTADELGTGPLIGPRVGKVVAVPSVITERRWVRVVPDAVKPCVYNEAVGADSWITQHSHGHPANKLGRAIAGVAPQAYGAVGELFPILRMETDAEMKQPNQFRRAYDAYLEGDRAKLGKDLSRWVSEQLGVHVRVVVGEPEADTPTEVRN